MYLEPASSKRSGLSTIGTWGKNALAELDIKELHYLWTIQLSGIALPIQYIKHVSGL